jgi:hypothetical protein|mmetsp:Transcript_7495/g.8957  ORF Transcript_7495/g.8957 Transcript_7495/m.8957 type:complete len:237 (+) Transcript_7495:98-808(+)|eukprot:CAMPEP_0195274380 /NCGR_PEP_ID=MMETSP0706-20130129/17116_1 /TAXON_ID=33640 /ORGANISM="Asterionellopsis glacialis, Strain CCMP134" /LENGTH=236 /DNA_ID=CAMNT_0040331241 /DNA_START=59 /DNA_END=769 /DNA_ORIENTATION=-
MKLSTAAILGFIGGASAFAPASRSSSTTSAVRMSEEAAELLEVKEKVPCFGATPLLGEPVFVGENYWDKLTMEYGSEATGTFLQAAELKHGRSAMVATVGFLFHKFGWTLDNISPHEYLSVTQGVKFADLAAMTPLDAMKSVPAEGLTQMFAAIALVEIYELSHKDGKLAEDERVAPGLQAGGLTGDLGWNPLNIKVTDRRRLVEIQNGRAAMFAICAWVAHDSVAGSVPLPLLWS